MDGFEKLMAQMAAEEKFKKRGHSAKALLDMALEHNGSSARAAALIILSLEADNWFKFSAIELVHLDENYREHANNVLLGVKACDFKPSDWLKRLDMDVRSEVNELIEQYRHLIVD